jgi:hypothetical protein
LYTIDGNFQFFFEWEQYINEQYSALFIRKDNGGGIATVEIDERYTWISMVDRLAGGDITKYEQIYEQNYINVLNILSFYREKDNYIESINKQRK